MFEQSLSVEICDDAEHLSIDNFEFFSFHIRLNMPSKELLSSFSATFVQERSDVAVGSTV
jgi:hypothetical protein